MSRLQIHRGKRLAQASDADDEAVAEHAPFAAAAGELTRSSRFAFRYSYTEISAVGRDASVKHTLTRYENGRLQSESFEGTYDRTAYDALARSANAYVLRQSALLMKSLLWFLPSAHEDPREGD